MKYFKTSEFDCQCGCGKLPTQELMDKADRIRIEWGKPLNCVSGVRCMKHTVQLRARGIPAALGSAHLEGLAMDLCPVNLEDLPAFTEFCKKNLARWNLWMEDPMFTTMWVHLDMRKRSTRIFKP